MACYLLFIISRADAVNNPCNFILSKTGLRRTKEPIILEKNLILSAYISDFKAKTYNSFFKRS